MSKLALFIFIVPLIFVNISCGGGDSSTNANNSKIEVFTNEPGTALAATAADFENDEEFAAKEIANSVENSLQAAQQEISISNSSTGATFKMDDPLTPVSEKVKSPNEHNKQFRECMEQGDGSAIVSISRGIQRQGTNDRPRVFIERVFAKLTNITRTWRKEGENIVCDATRKTANLEPALLKGASINSTFSHEKESNVFLSVKATDERFDHSRRFRSSGSRVITFEDVTNDGDNTIVDKSVILSATRINESKKKDGEFRMMEWTTSTPEALKVKVTRDSTNKITSREIISGTTQSIGKTQGLMRTSYEKLLFQEDCSPVSGTINGEIFPEATSETITGSGITFTIDFSADPAMISFAGQIDSEKTTNFDLSGCIFDNPKSIVESSNREKVLDPS